MSAEGKAIHLEMQRSIKSRYEFEEGTIPAELHGLYLHRINA